MAAGKETTIVGLIPHDNPSLTDVASYAKLLFDETCKAVRALATLPEEQRRIFEDHAAKFERSLEAILSINDKHAQWAALNAAISALSIGYYHPGNPEVARELKSRLMKEHTAPANAVRRGPIGKIIDSHARRETNRRGFGGDYGYTKKTIITAILRDVLKEVSKLDAVPDNWKVQDPNKLTKEERNRVRENIRVYIRRSSVFG